MALVSITDVEVLSTESRFDEPYRFKITFECVSALEDGWLSCSGKAKATEADPGLVVSEDIEWKLIYVGSAESSKYDQELDACMVGPVPAGVNSFEFEVRTRVSIIHQPCTVVLTHPHRLLHLLPPASPPLTY